MYRLIVVVINIILSMHFSSSYAGQDPMRPPSWVSRVEAPMADSGAIKLQQILISQDRKIVIINDKVLTEGQSIAGAKITKIEAEYIKIRRKGVSKTIKLLPATKEVNSEI